MKKITRKTLLTTAILAGLFSGQIATAQVVINEFQYDDTGTADDREFIELYNPGAVAVDISGWTVSGRDPTAANSSATIPANTSIAAGGFYVLGNTGVLNVNQTIAAGFLENDNETIELSNGALVVDALAYETNKGVGFADPVSAQVGTGIFGNHQGSDLAGTPLNASVSLGRFVDGRDTNNNGRDFGLRPSTPGTSNAPGGYVKSFQVPNPSSSANGTPLASTAGSFVNAVVIDPTVADANNPNAITVAAGSAKAYVAWDPSGGGNGVTSLSSYATREAAFAIRAFLDTRALPVQTNATNVEFTGSEVTIYGIGSGDALTNLTDLSGAIGLGSGTLPGSDSADGVTGIAWVYEKTSLRTSGTAATQRLFLVDANDGGDSQPGGNTPLDWIVLATYELPATSSGGWYDLSIEIQPDGSGVARFNGIATAFSSLGFNSGAFNIGYRENLQIGADATPDAIMRPATFTVVPEPASVLLVGFGLVGVLRRRNRTPRQ